MFSRITTSQYETKTLSHEGRFDYLLYYNEQYHSLYQTQRIIIEQDNFVINANYLSEKIAVDTEI